MGFSNRQTLVKVPELLLIFWVAKVGTTCFGEAFSDFVFFNDASWITRDRAIAAGAVLILIAYGTAQVTSATDMQCLHATPRCLPPQEIWSVSIVVG